MIAKERHKLNIRGRGGDPVRSLSQFSRGYCSGLLSSEDSGRGNPQERNPYRALKKPVNPAPGFLSASVSGGNPDFGRYLDWAGTFKSIKILLAS
ncbi:hypothetical protein [Cyclobacterium xiamenense]|uniref:hypothetical protein n=1 Tax=Cyclobacterium xiamenense TaxID=1297121 RepID=UPI0035D00A21